MVRIPFRFFSQCTFTLLFAGLLCVPAFSQAVNASEDGGAGVLQLQSAELPDEAAFGLSLYNNFVNIPPSYVPGLNSLIQGHTVTLTDDNATVENSKLWAINNILAASFSANRFIEAHVALPLYSQALYYGGLHSTSVLASGDVRYGLKLALPYNQEKSLFFALMFGGSLPTSEIGAIPVPQRLEYFSPNENLSAAPSRGDGTHRYDFDVGFAATFDFERTSLDFPLKLHANTGVRKTSLFQNDGDFQDVYSVGAGFENRVATPLSIVGQYWHENYLRNAPFGPVVDNVSLGLAVHTPIGLSVLLGGTLGLRNDALPVTFYDSKDQHQYDFSARTSPAGQITLAIIYTAHLKPKDSDGDGVPDSRDKCPTIPQGRYGKDGCPALDSDGDGIPDYLDKCPYEPQGPFGVDGCPIHDRDNDGVPDSIDKCPDVPQGPDGKDGCPAVHDRDGDGVPDSIDKCPDVPQGLNGKDGCPAPKAVPKKILPVEQKTLILQGVYFELGKAVLIPQSYEALNDIAAQLNSATQVELEVGGHTDNLGSPKVNQKLSLARAKTVAEFLIRRGVDPRRLKVVGYGSSRPIASNKTEQGRLENRRVEFTRLK